MNAASKNFRYLFTQIMLVMVVLVLAINIFLAKPAIDSLPFALALAVGLTPELLPAIISITISHGAQQIAKRGVIVRRLNSIENFGCMDVLCTDKTGTLTEGIVRLDWALDPSDRASTSVLNYTYLNSQYQTGINNPLDDAISVYAQRAGIKIGIEQKIDEIPFDFAQVSKRGDSQYSREAHSHHQRRAGKYSETLHPNTVCRSNRSAE